MVSVDDAWAVATGATGQPAEVLRYRGGAWEVVQSYPDRNLLAIDMVSAEEGWAVGFDLAPIRAVLLPIRAGQVASPEYPPCSAVIDVHMSDDGSGWAGGNRTSGSSSVSCILRFVGGQWARANSPDAGLIVALAMTGPDEGWAVGAEGGLLRWEDGAWTEAVSLLPVGSVAFTDGSVADSTIGWIVGTDLAKSLRLEGGTWWPVDIGQPGALFGVDIISRQEGWAVGRTDLDWPLILRYDGQTWTPEELPDLGGLRQLSAIDMLSSTDGWAVGGGTALRYHADAVTPTVTADPTGLLTPTATHTMTPSVTVTATPGTTMTRFLPWAWRR
jgi:hypothetical protein